MSTETEDAIVRTKKHLSQRNIVGVDVSSIDQLIVLEKGDRKAKGSPSEICTAIAKASEIDSESLWRECETAGLDWKHN